MTTNTYDVIILGTGPAGLQAAIHAVRSKVSVLVLGKQHKSSLYRAHIENYCCLSKIDGETLLQDGRKQAEHFGANFCDEDAVEIKQADSWFHIKVESGTEIRSRAIIFALGVFRNKLN
ncbi:MAG: NAD(P)/FAD-dependent oxidoreductase, partial [Deltaproteobacteria bacterium]|nr:NAD(P)/FAD-dependent oxidoreductase [Deltaproteobacteria bacterium]